MLGLIVVVRVVRYEEKVLEGVTVLRVETVTVVTAVEGLRVDEMLGLTVVVTVKVPIDNELELALSEVLGEMVVVTVVTPFEEEDLFVLVLIGAVTVTVVMSVGKLVVVFLVDEGDEVIMVVFWIVEVIVVRL